MLPLQSNLMGGIHSSPVAVQPPLISVQELFVCQVALRARIKQVFVNFSVGV